MIFSVQAAQRYLRKIKHRTSNSAVVSSWIPRLPPPHIRAHRLKVAHGGPPQLVTSPGHIGKRLGHVTWTPADDFVGDRATRRFFERVNDFEHCMTAACAQVDAKITWRIRAQQRIDGGDMTDCEIRYVNEVTDTGAIGCRKVVAEDLQLWQASYGHLRNVGHKIVRRIARIFAHHAAFMRTDGIEVAQADDAPARVGPRNIVENLLDDQLCVAVGIYRRDGTELRQRHSRCHPVYCGRRAENHSMHGVCVHRLEERR